MTKDAIGWAASVVLLLTLSKQVHAQWKAGTSKGVSPWLFVGELVASSLFFTYSLVIHTWVYVVTNVLTFLSTCVGLVVWVQLRRRDGSSARVGARSPCP